MKTEYKPVGGKNNIWTVFRNSQRQIIMLLFLMILVGCSKEGTLIAPDTQDPLEMPQDNLLDPLEEPENNLIGSLEELKNYYSVEFVDAMVELDFNINLGNNPPNLEGSYLISPFILEDSTVEADSASIGGQFQDYLAVFSNQDNSNLTIDLEGIQQSQVDNGSGSFVTGDNLAFSVYAKTISEQGSSVAETAIVISGVLSPNGILDIQFFGAMLDDNGDPENVYIENNTGRFLIDGDGFSPKQDVTSKSVIKSNLINWTEQSE